jgi:acyl-CoA thioester hydrolase
MENSFMTKVEVRWSDLDPNFHLRHSVYYDYCAYARIKFLNEKGLTAVYMAQNKFGPILFREECIFRKEIHLGDTISIDLRLLKGRKDHSRWSIQHQIFKNDDVLSAVITVDGAWIDTVQRKLTTPPERVWDVFDHMPRAEKFEWMN